MLENHRFLCLVCQRSEAKIGVLFVFFGLKAGDKGCLDPKRGDRISVWVGRCCCSSVVERVLGKDEVMGSSPISS